MPIFQKATNEQAYAKVGIMGFAGSGKTFTATNISIGLVQMLREKNLVEKDRPVMFLDTETGSDWAKPFFDEAGIELFTAKTRAFRDLIPAINEAESDGSVLIIDSISHFWRELTDAYAERKNRKYGLQFQDWAWLKQQWGFFTDRFVNSSAHIIMCGRAGYEYDFFQNEEGGKKELEKTGIKMKAEAETGYEPSMLILMERTMDFDTKQIVRVAHILKDRSTRIDGKSITNPCFEDFRPHFEFLNFGGHHVGVDTTRNSKGMVQKDGKSEWQLDREQSEIVLDEIKELLTKHYGGQSVEAKQKKGDLLEKHFLTRSWVKIEKTYKLAQLKEGYNTLHQELENVPAYFDGQKDAAKPEPRSVAQIVADIRDCPDAGTLDVLRIEAEAACDGDQDLWLDVQTMLTDRSEELKKSPA